MATWYVKVNLNSEVPSSYFVSIFALDILNLWISQKTFLGPIEFKINDVQLYVSKSKRP